MAVIVSETFDGATSGNATTSTTGATSKVSGTATLQHSTAQTIAGASLLCSTGGGTYLEWARPARDKSFTRLYVRVSAFSAAAALVMAELRTFSPANEAAALLQFNGRIYVRNVGGSVANYPATTNQWYRADWSVESGVGQILRLYTGATLHSLNTADAVAGGGLLAYTGGQQANLRVGTTAATTTVGSYFMDEMKIDDAALPPPWSAQVGRRLERKVSGAWVPQIVEKKVSGVWVPQIIEHKDAGVWS